MAQVTCPNCQTVNDPEKWKWSNCVLCGYRLESPAATSATPQLPAGPTLQTPASRPTKDIWPEVRRMILFPLLLGGLFALFVLVVSSLSAYYGFGLKSKLSGRVSAPATWDDVPSFTLWGSLAGLALGFVFDAFILAEMLKDIRKSRKK